MLTYFSLFHFYNLWNRQKTFLGGVEMEDKAKMG